MSFFSVFITGIALSMDAMSVSISQALCLKIHNNKNALKIGLAFGFFQFFMTYLGFSIGNLFPDIFFKYSKYISFFIFFSLSAIAIKDCFDNSDEKECRTLSIINLIIMGFATSLDAFFIGFTFLHMEKLKIFLVSIEIGIITFIISYYAYILTKQTNFLTGKFPNILAGILLLFLAINSLLN